MLLVIDVGNSSIAIGVFDRDRLKATWRVATEARKTSDEYAVLIRNLLPWSGIALEEVRNAVIGSVVPPLVRKMVEACERCGIRAPLVVGAGVRSGIKIFYEHPKDVGADRIANAVAAMRVYGPPAIIVDLGTATTIDVVTAEGEYLGGAIAPGLTIASEALFEQAAKLPRVEIVQPRVAIGRSTITAIQSGVYFGYVGLVDGIVDRVRQELQMEAQVIATGGHAELIAKESRTIDQVDPNLTLLGLWHINQLNRPER